MTIKTKGWDSFLALCQARQSSDELDELLRALLTPEEIIQLGLRVELLNALLKKEKPQRHIAAGLGVSIATITRGSNMLKSIDPQLYQFLKEKLQDVRS